MSWNTELAYFVTPKSGPMRPMRTLVDVNRALLDDLPFVSRLRPHWAAVARLLLIASDTGSTIDVRLATDALVRALETEGWMTRARGTVALSPSDKTQSAAERGQMSTSVSSSGVGATPPAARVVGATRPAFAVEPCLDAAAEGCPAPAGIGGPPVFGAPAYRPGEIDGPTARTLDESDDVPGLILRKLPAAPAHAGAPRGAVGGRQGRGTRRPADTKL